MATKVTYSLIGVDTDGSTHVVVPNATSIYPAMVTPPTITVTVEMTWVFSTSASTPAQVPVLDVKWSWTSMEEAGSITYGAQIAVALAIDNPGGVMSVIATLMVNLKDRFSELWLYVYDVANPSNNQKDDLLSGLSDGVWAEIAGTPVNTSTWGPRLRLVLCARGTTNYDHVGLTTLSLEALGYKS